jgi:hypothetical protein
MAEDNGITVFRQDGTGLILWITSSVVSSRERLAPFQAFGGVESKIDLSCLSDDSFMGCSNRIAVSQSHATASN